ncbi:5-carboxymethyl-2-hydroxymuconate Delta-isomerase [Alteribacter natronophilus]|uniref:5-carboxymethyl-2-hydroxymuconate Delta-isomerase n=1 Tax=Alteribacter natronophilus TaxID=2583810 RepID=UPI00110F37E0|nr:5-carboxymethyl-2-hydroxymuconate Delta-isomerase [Alteribacter natronophilus]TMW71079.1 5-carboxymethyl-2-hydroxymuconate isomerase [Alteribacter natronophilus]
MPHIIVEYTDNLTREEFHPKTVLDKINKVFTDRPDVFPVGGVRSRAIRLTDYMIADGAGADDAFVHVTVKIAPGRTQEQKDDACGELFDSLCDYLSPVYDQRGLALSLELYEFGDGGTYKKNNIHKRYKQQ